MEKDLMLNEDNVTPDEPVGDLVNNSDGTANTFDWTDDNKCYQVVSDLGEVEKRKFHLYVGKTNKMWLVGDQPNAADNIYVSDGEHSQGFDGRTVTFTLINGKTIDIRGPWHSTSAALYADTGIDVRDKYSTFVVVALGMEYQVSLNSPTMFDVQYIDEKWTVGEYDRGDKIAQKIANKLGRPVFRYIKSKGGCHSGPIKPNNTEQPISN